jgi:hypothetical protein
MTHQVMILANGNAVLPVHFVVRKTGRIACTPTKFPLHHEPGREETWQRTDDPRAVSCPLCEETEEYKVLRQEVEAAVASRRPAL